MTAHLAKTVSLATLYLVAQLAALYLLASKLITGPFALP